MFAQVDCTVETSICGKHGVRGYPTIKLFVNGTFIEYDAAREVDDMKFWIQSMFKPILQEKSFSAAEEEAKKSHKTSFFFVRTNNPDHFEELLKSFKGKVAFGYEKSDQEELVAVREGVEIKFTGEQTTSEIGKFIRQNSIPFFTHLSPANFGLTLNSGAPLIILHGKKEESADEIKTLTELAKSRKIAANFGFLPADNISAQFVEEELKFDASKPMIFALEFQNHKLFKKGIYFEKGANLEEIAKQTLVDMEEVQVEEEPSSTFDPKILIIAICTATVIVIVSFCLCCRSDDKEVAQVEKAQPAEEQKEVTVEEVPEEKPAEVKQEEVPVEEKEPVEEKQPEEKPVEPEPKPEPEEEKPVEEP